MNYSRARLGGMIVPKWNVHAEKAEEWLTPEEAGKRVPGTLGAAAIRKWVRSGKLPGSIRLPNGHWRIPANAIEALYVDPEQDGQAGSQS